MQGKVEVKEPKKQWKHEKLLRITVQELSLLLGWRENNSSRWSWQHDFCGSLKPIKIGFHCFGIVQSWLFYSSIDLFVYV